MKYTISSVVFLLIFSGSLFSQKTVTIRSIDFSNFTFPGSRRHFPTPEYETTKFTLKDGASRLEAMRLYKVIYGDVNGDGVEEAILVLNVVSEGSASIDHVYIYKLENNHPKFLWGFEGGDRSWGGLRRVYAKDGGLIIELWGKDTHLGGDLFGSEVTAMCCPKSFTRSFYRWQTGTFREKGKAEILPNPMAQKQCPTCLPDSEKNEWH